MSYLLDPNMVSALINYGDYEEKQIVLIAY